MTEPPPRVLARNCCATCRVRSARPRAARRRRRARTPHHHSAHTEDRPRARPASTQYLRPGRVLVFGDSEVRYLETLTPDERAAALRRVFSHELRACSSPAGARRRPKRSPKPTGAGVPLLRPRRRRRTPSRSCRRCSMRTSRRGHGPRRADGHPRTRRARHRRERHRQERVRARSRRPRATGWSPTTSWSCGVAHSRS